MVALATMALGFLIPAIQTYPAALTLTTGPFWADAMQWINVNFFDTFEAIKLVILQWLLLPVKKFLSTVGFACNLPVANASGQRKKRME